MDGVPITCRVDFRRAGIFLAIAIAALLMPASACQASSPLPDGAYALSCATAPSCLLDVAGGPAASGSAVDLGIKSKATTNKWLFRDTGGGKYLIQPADAPNLALTDAKSGIDDGSPVDLESVKRDPCQLWTLKRIADGVYSLCPECAVNLSLHDFAGGTAPGSRVDVWTDDPSDTDVQWRIDPYTDAPFKSSLADGTYTITPHDGTSLVLAAAGGSSNPGTGVVGAAPDGSPGQKWTVASASDGMITISAGVGSHMALTVKDGATAMQTPLVLQPLKPGDPSQLWHPIELGGDGAGQYMLVPACAPKEAIDNPGGAKNPGTTMWIWDTDSNNSHQWWIFKAVK